MSIPETSLPTEAELREGYVIFHKIDSDELSLQLKQGAKFVKFTIARVRGAIAVIVMPNWIGAVAAIKNVPDCTAIGGGEIHEKEKKDVNSLHSLEEVYGTRPIPSDLMAIIRKRILAYLPEETK